jgi:acetate kinase
VNPSLHEPILVLNAGSSSLKFSVYETGSNGTLIAGAHGQVERIDTRPHLSVTGASGAHLAECSVEQRGHAGAIAAIHHWFADHVGNEAGFSAVGHRVVHGGATYVEPTLIDAQVLAAIEALTPLAPLHQPHHVAAIRAVQAFAPHLPQIACFDTAFHHRQPAIASEYALPRRLTEQGVRRYGFHGLSYEYIMSYLPEVAPQSAQGRVVVAHLGNGASMCAIDNGVSIASTMGFTAVDGLPMGTRTGTLDPGVILYLLRHEGMTVDQVEHLIYEESGLLGMSGVSADMRTLLMQDTPQTRHAIDLFVYRIGRELGSLVAALGGIDALVLTGGIGEHAPAVRAQICRSAHWLGVSLDRYANLNGNALISDNESKVPVWVIPTDENLMIARHTRRLLDMWR